jgi:hypothetical protein
VVVGGHVDVVVDGDGDVEVDVSECSGLNERSGWTRRAVTDRITA